MALKTRLFLAKYTLAIASVYLDVDSGYRERSRLSKQL